MNKAERNEAPAKLKEFQKAMKFIIENVNLTKLALSSGCYIFLKILAHNYEYDSSISLIKYEDIGIAVFYAFYLLPWTLNFFVKGLALITHAFTDAVADTPDENQKVATDTNLELQDKKRKEAVEKIQQRIQQRRHTSTNKEENVVANKIIFKTIDAKKIKTHNNKL